VKNYCFLFAIGFSVDVVSVVSIFFLISLVTLVMTCLCCYGLPNDDDDSIDGLLLEQYTDKSLSSMSHIPSTSSVR